MSVLYLDIATIPDFELGARLYDLHDLSQEDVARVMFTKSREKTINPGVLDHHILQIAAISVLIQDGKGLKSWSTGVPGSSEASLLETLQQLTAEHKPSIVTWNGNRSIFPILNYRYLSHGLRAPLFTNYIDLATELSGTTAQDSVSLNEVAVLCGFPGNMVMTSEDVLNAYLAGNNKLIQNKLELNIMNTWLLYQRWQLLCGNIDHSSHEVEYQQLKEALLQLNKSHLTQFVEALN